MRCKRSMILKEVAVVELQVVSNSFVASWTIAYQAPLSMGFPRQEYWHGLPFSSPGDLPDPGVKPVSPAPRALQADSLPLKVIVDIMVI